MTKDEIIRMAREAGFERLGTYASFGEDWVAFTESLERFANLAAAAEREACAKVCDEFQARDVGMQPAECAGAIRARGNT